MLGRLGGAFKALIIQQYIQGYLEEYFTDATFEEVLRLARSGQGWDAISPDIKRRMLLQARENKAALRTIAMDDIYTWLIEANSELAKQMFADREVIAWLGKCWQEFEMMRADVPNG